MKITPDITVGNRRGILSLIARLLIAAALLAVLISNGDSVYQTQVYSDTQSGVIRPIGPITAGSSYVQPLLFNRDISRITSFSILFATYARPDYADETARIEVSLADGDGQVLFREEVIVGTLEDNQFRAFVPDDPIQVDRGAPLSAVHSSADQCTPRGSRQPGLSKRSCPPQRSEFLEQKDRIQSAGLRCFPERRELH